MSYGDPFRNEKLFAPHYLRDKLHDDPFWTDETGLADAFAAVQKIWTGAELSDRDNEAQTEAALIRPILDRLWPDSYKVQVTLPNLAASARQPDYAMFRSPAALQQAGPKLGGIDYFTTVAVIGDAKAWSADLDRRRGNETPSAQIANYLYRSRVRWGILTNGRLWRLYEREKSAAGGVFYEVDLQRLFEGGSLADFKYFHHFFSQRAFDPDADGRGFVDRVDHESDVYRAEVEEGLKDSVYDALRLLMTGFLDQPANALDRATAGALEAVHENALILLYRLLFIFYAEDKKLLPYDRPPYQTYSLYHLHREINGQLRAKQPYLTRATSLWSRLQNLFQLIDQGDEAAGIPEYNGGLFSPRLHPRLAPTPRPDVPAWSVGDAALAQVIDLLAYKRKRGANHGTEDVDYSTLAVQHLGSIYEGLLELRPHLAAEPLVEVYRGNRSTFEPAASAAAEPSARRIPAGGVYLITDRGERKTTGSYYTPKYIVDYIVENTLGPLVDQAAAEVAARADQVQAQIDALAADAARWARSDLKAERDQAAAAPARTAALRESLLEPYLRRTVLDPAMGSGHFLVGAADFLSLAMATDPHLAEPTSLGGEEPQLYYKRKVVERCLYGVDLNPLAVELAKLSLWLHTVSGDRALSFLDHHLRCGNSLVGARLTGDLSTPPPRLDAKGKPVRDTSGQLSFGFTETLKAQHLQYLLDTFARIAEAPAGDATAERQKAAWYAEMDLVRDRFRRVADLWLAPYFGAEVTAEQYGAAIEALQGGSLAAVEEEPWFTAAHEVAKARRFFHWELEFPEVFLTPQGVKPEGEAGFEAVIGNPPYVRQEQLGRDKLYYASRYPAVYHGMADLFVYFFGRGLELVRPEQRLSYISSNSWLQTAYAEPLRRHVRTWQTVETLLDLGNNRTFAEAPDVCPSIFVIRRQAAPEEHRFACVAFGRGEEPRLTEPVLAEKTIRIAQSDQPDAGWQLTDDATRRLIAKLLDTGRPLGEVVGGRMYRGVLTGLNDAFIIDQATRDRLVAEDAGSAEILKPLVRGEDLRPWYQEDEGRWLVFARRGIEIEKYPAVLAYLEGYRERLEPRPADWQGRGWPGRKPGNYAWYEIQDTVDYWRAFEEPKIFWPDICKYPRFSWDDLGKYCNDKGSIVADGRPMVASVLQSRCVWMAISFIAVHNKYRSGLWEYQLKSQFVERIPLALPSGEEAKLLTEQAQQLRDLAFRRDRTHRTTRHRLQSDLGTPDRKLNQKLTAWWELDFGEVRAEVRKSFKQDIPVAERGEWEAWLAAQRAEHERLTAKIIDLETELNDRVYHLYGLTRAEIEIVERTTKYEYGLV